MVEYKDNAAELSLEHRSRQGKLACFGGEKRSGSNGLMAVALRALAISIGHGRLTEWSGGGKKRCFSLY